VARTIGKAAITLALAGEEELPVLLNQVRQSGYQVVVGKVGSMDAEKIVAAVETAAKRSRLIKAVYQEEHSLYHAVIEAFHGVCRGQLELGSILRTVGLNFAVVRGPREAGPGAEGEWLAVALYGTIGAPIKGFEHEVVGLGINHL